MEREKRARFGYEFRITTKREEVKKEGQDNIISTEKNLGIYIAKFEENHQSTPKKKSSIVKDSVIVVVGVLSWLWRIFDKYFSS